MTDVFSVTAAYDKPTYVAGDKITVAITGGDVLTQTVSSQVGPLVIPIIAADGAISTVSVPQTTASVTTTTPESVVIDTTRPIVDSSPTPRVWTVAANKLSISAVA